MHWEWIVSMAEIKPEKLNRSFVPKGSIFSPNLPQPKMSPFSFHSPKQHSTFTLTVQCTPVLKMYVIWMCWAEFCLSVCIPNDCCNKIISGDVAKRQETNESFMAVSEIGPKKKKKKKFLSRGIQSHLNIEEEATAKKTSSIFIGGCNRSWLKVGHFGTDVDLKRGPPQWQLRTTNGKIFPWILFFRRRCPIVFFGFMIPSEELG